MPVAVVCLAAVGVIRDMESNQISVFNIIEQLAPQGFPALIPQIGILTIWQRGDADPPHGIEYQFRATNNDRQLFRHPGVIDFGESVTNRSIVTIAPLAVHEPGRLEFSFLLNDQVAAQYGIVVLAPPVQGQIINEPPRPPAPDLGQ